jgi:nucleoside-diphosphate-sugar epimerase
MVNEARGTGNGRYRALVTGAGGFIGTHFVRYLAARGWDVRAADIHPASVSVPDVDYRTVDICDAAVLRGALEGVDYVFNLASVHLDVHASYDKFEAVNVRALEQLVELCSEVRVRRLVQVSSVGVYGHVILPPAREDAPLNPENTYERTKMAGEEAARRAAERTGLDVVVLRPSWVYGTGCPRTEKLLRSLRKGRFFYIGRARNLRHPVYIDDLLDGLVLAALADPSVASGRTFNIAGPQWMTVQEMVGQFAAGIAVPAPTFHLPRWLGLTVGWTAEQLSALVGAEPLISRRTLAFFENDNAFDIGAARRWLGYDPKVELADGVGKIAGTNVPGRVAMSVH